ncbi:unnamed protein product [Camellia sinensis]
MSEVGANSQANSQLPVDGLQPSISVESETSLPSQPPLPNQNVLDVDDSDSSLATRKNPSFVWQHFKKEKIDGVWKAICNYCKKHLGGNPKHGTSHLRDHYRSCLKKRKGMDMRQRVLTSNFNKESPKVSYSFDEDIARRELSNAIILHEYPLSIVDHIGFKRYSMALQPLFKVPSRNTIKSDILKIYDNEKEKIMRLVQSNQSKVAITTDMWTSSNQKKGFMAVTAHFIDDSWSLQSRILRFIYVPCPHTKEVLCDILLNCLMDWDLDRKVSAITVDNCSTNDAMINILLDKLDSSSLLLGGTLFHMRCCAHILNLIVKDGLDVIRVGVEKIRDSVAYWTATPKRVEKFEETARQVKNLNTKKMGLDCATRWNSTYLMLQTALLYKDVFYRLKYKETQYTTLPSEEEWEFAREICGRFKIFYRATELFSGTKYPTANVAFPNLCEIRITISQWLSCSIEVVRSMASKMLGKFDKYWVIIHGLIGVAVVLDPRYKLSVLEFYFDKLYGDTAEEEIAKIRQLCYDLLQEYQRKLSLGTDANVESSTSLNFGDSEVVSDYDLFISRKRRKKVNHVTSELDHYLEEDVVTRTPNFDVLTWWKSNASKYPTLQAIARDFLAIPVSTVASESAFSTSGRLVSPYRSRLHPDTLEALMCAQSWLWAVEMQGNSTLESVGYATIYDEMDVNQS